MKKLFLIIFLCYISTNISGQNILYGINFDKSYPEIKSEGTKNLSKVIILKDKSVFYRVRVSSFDFVFSAIQNGFDPFKNPKKYYKKGLLDIKKVFGEPINIYTDSSFQIKTSDFYLWKVKREKGYFLVYYGLSDFGLSLNVTIFHNEETINEHIRNDIFAQQRFSGQVYHFNKKELNMPHWY